MQSLIGQIFKVEQDASGFICSPNEKSIASFQSYIQFVSGDVLFVIGEDRDDTLASGDIRTEWIALSKFGLIWISKSAVTQI